MTKLTSIWGWKFSISSRSELHYVGSYISEYLQCSERIFDDEQRPGKEMALMPTLLSTTVKHIHESAKFCELEVNRGFSLLHERQHDL